MACNCKSYKYASDYSRITNLAHKLANAEKVEYWVYQKIDGSYGCDKKEFVPKGSPVQLKAIPEY